MLLPGLGAVSTTLIAGVHLIRKGLARPIGSVTQMQQIRLGKRTEPRFAPIKELVPLAELSDLVFGGWDIFPDNAYEAAIKAGVLPAEMLVAVREELEAVEPMAGRFRPRVGQAPRRPEREDGADEDAPRRGAHQGHRGLPQVERAARAVMVWCGSTEVYAQQKPVHESLAGVRAGPQGELPRDLALDDLRLRRDRERHPLRQRRAEPVGRRSRL